MIEFGFLCYMGQIPGMLMIPNMVCGSTSTKHAVRKRVKRSWDHSGPKLIPSQQNPTGSLASQSVKFYRGHGSLHALNCTSTRQHVVLTLALVKQA